MEKSAAIQNDVDPVGVERCFNKCCARKLGGFGVTKRRGCGKRTASGLLISIFCALAVSVDASIGPSSSMTAGSKGGGNGSSVIPAIRRTLGPSIRLLNYKHPLAIPSVKRRRSIHVATRSTSSNSRRSINKPLSTSERIRKTLSGGVYYGLGEKTLSHYNVVKNVRATKSKRNNAERRNKEQEDPNIQLSTDLPVPAPTLQETQNDTLSPGSFTKDTNEGEEGRDIETLIPNIGEGDEVSEAETNMLFRETIKELRRTADTIRLEMELLRKEIREFYEERDENNNNNNHKLNRMGRKRHNRYNDDESDDDETIERFNPATPAKSNSERRHMFDHMAMSVEEWAEQLIRENGNKEHGWKSIECNSFLKRKYNPQGNTQCYLKWMGDSRGDGFVEVNDKGEYPCIKCFGKLDAPIEKVCAFLANEQGMGEYNELVENYRDLEDVSPYSKICWGQCPQILFVKPRDFVTFCSHRWKRDGTQVIVNQAVDHDDAPKPITCEKSCDAKDGRACRARALRGANIIAKDPSDPDNKTIFTLIAHADPGGGLPKWACKTAVNAVAPIEPFKLYYNLNQAVQKFTYVPPQNNIDDEDDDETRTDFVSAQHSCSQDDGQAGRSRKPGGCSQLGYACFWPNGGGLEEDRR